MKLVYSGLVDGWTEHPHGHIEISDKAWKVLSHDGVIPCSLGFTDTVNLVGRAASIDKDSLA